MLSINSKFYQNPWREVSRQTREQLQPTIVSWMSWLPLLLEQAKIYCSLANRPILNWLTAPARLSTPSTPSTPIPPAMPWILPELPLTLDLQALESSEPLRLMAPPESNSLSSSTVTATREDWFTETLSFEPEDICIFNLAAAIEEGSLEQVKEALSLGVDTLPLDYLIKEVGKQTILELAVRNGRLEILKYMLNFAKEREALWLRKAAVYPQTTEVSHSLAVITIFQEYERLATLAGELGFENIEFFLLTLSVNSGKRARGHLFNAILEGDSQACLALNSLVSSYVNSLSSSDYRTLPNLAEFKKGRAGRETILSLKVQEFLNSQLNSTHDSLLHVAIKHGRLQMARLLLHMRIDPYLENKEGLEARDIAENCLTEYLDEQINIIDDADYTSRTKYLADKIHTYKLLLNLLNKRMLEDLVRC